MTEQLEQAVKRAISAFVAAIIRSAERAAIESIRSGFAEVQLQMGHALLACAEVPPPDERARSRKSARIHERADRRKSPMADATRLDRIVACVTKHPGSTVMQLVPHANIHETTLRRHLRRLADEGLIRIEEHPSARFGGQTRRLYFAVERVNGASPKASGIPAEAMA